MKKPRGIDDFELLLAEALEPGEIHLSAAEHEEILGAAAFMALLARELDPGRIAFEPGQRRDLVARLAAVSKGEELTAWALGELEEDRRVPLEARMKGDEDLRTEVLAIRNFCSRVELMLPAIALPGWWERRRLRRVFSGHGLQDRAVWLAGVAAVALILVFIQMPESPGIPKSAQSAVVESAESVPLPASGPEPTIAFVAGGTGVEERVAPSPLPAIATESLHRWPGVLFPVLPPGLPEEREFTFTALPLPRVVVPSAGPVADLEELLAILFKIGDDAPAMGRRPLELELESGAHLLASLDGVGAINSPRMAIGSRDLVAATAAIERANGSNPGPDAGPGDLLPAVVPESGSLVLAQSQPYLLSALLRGPVSGRPDLSRTGTGRWVSADFQAMDFNLPSGNGGVESDSWRIEAGMSWLLSPSWQAGVSLAGIDSRMEVPGFGTVDAEGAAFSWSLDWRKDGYHAALTHTLGTFDQDLRRFAGGMLYPAGQDATVQLLSLWLTREFEAGEWTHGPVAGMEASWGSLEGYQEPFAGGVSMAGRDFELATSLIGWQVSRRFDTPAGEWSPRAVLGWRHRLCLADASMVQGSSAGSFVVPPVSPERDSLLLEGGLRWVPPGGLLFFDAVSSSEWRDGEDSENSLLFKLGVNF